MGLSDWDSSAEAWIASVDHDANRMYVLDKPMLEECGDLANKRVLDVGCGEGRFCRMVAERGALPVGIDPTQRLISEARRLDPNSRYEVAYAEELPLEEDAFDIVVSYLSLIDIADYRAAIKEAVRVLKPGGRLIIANLQSFATTFDYPWLKDPNGNKIHFRVDHYNEERGNEVAWNGISVINYHRPLGDYMSALLEHGLILKSFREPLPDEDAIAAYPPMADYLRVPIMLVMSWEKP